MPKLSVKLFPCLFANSGLVLTANVLMLEDARMGMIYPNNVRSQTRNYGHIEDEDKLTQTKTQMLINENNPRKCKKINIASTKKI